MTSPALSVLDADAMRDWCTAGAAGLSAARTEIDALNVFPVPDGDTGTNLAMTFAAVVDALRAAAPGDNPLADLPATAALVADAALRGARGSSGVIVSQMLRGFADCFARCTTAGADDLRHALARAADLGWKAVDDPVEGTVLSVARAAADAAAEKAGDDLHAVATAAADAARAALARTPEQLPALAAAGVVDAGGRGLVVLLDALVGVVTARPGTGSAESTTTPDVVVAAAAARSDGPAYEVQYLLEAAEEDAAILRERLAAIGVETAVVGSSGTYNVHVHVDDVGAAIEAGVEAGRPHRITVQRFADQVAARAATAQQEIAPVTPQLAQPAAERPVVVAVAVGTGMTALFRDAGAVVVSAAGHSPSVAEIADTIAATGSDRAVLLPNSADLHPVADAAARILRADGRTALVVPTRSPMQGLAALAVHDPSRRFEDDAVAMSAAAAATRYAAITRAVRAALTSAGPCDAGDVLGLIGDDVAVVGTELVEVCRGVIDRMLGGGGELVTLVIGADAPTDLGAELTEHLVATRPEVETVTYVGGQPGYPLLVGVE